MEIMGISILLLACIFAAEAHPHGKNMHTFSRPGNRPNAHEQAVLDFHEFIQNITGGHHHGNWSEGKPGKEGAGNGQGHDKRGFIDSGICCINMMMQQGIFSTEAYISCIQSGCTELPSPAIPTQATPTATPITTPTTTPESQTANAKCGRIVSKRSDLDDLDALDLDERIIGGVEAEKGEIPWIASIAYMRSYNVFCGGSILNESHIITAAHCVTDDKTDDPENLRVMLGEHNIKESEDDSEREHGVTRITVHPQYDSFLVKNDIALLEVTPMIDFSHPGITPVCIPETCQDLTGKDCLITGWGTTASGDMSPILKKASTKIESDSTCKRDYGYEVNMELEICARMKGIDTCQGDSGGPLTVSINGAHHLVGIVSWGYGCADPDYPGVYTRVCHFTDWIKGK